MNWFSKDSNDDIVLHRPQHWKSRLSVSLLLLGLTLIGILVTAFTPSIAWHYWSLMVPAFAALCLWLSWLNSAHHHLDGITIWHELLHWLALLLSVYLVYIFVYNGMMSNVIAGFFVLTLLALATFLAGIYIDTTFIFLGLTLGLVAIVTTLFIKYLLIIAIPIIILVALLLIWHHQKKRSQDD